jgi:hypothetical protein
MRSPLASLLAALLVSACVSPAKYDSMLQSWVGKSEDALVTKWGPPRSSATLSTGERVMEWVDQSSYTTQSRTEAPLVCTTRFTVSTKGTITSWSREGNYCAI